MLDRRGRRETAWQLEADADTELYRHAVTTQTEIRLPLGPTQPSETTD